MHARATASTCIFSECCAESSRAPESPIWAESLSEGLLGRVVVKRGRDVRPLFKFVILQVKFLDKKKFNFHSIRKHLVYASAVVMRIEVSTLIKKNLSYYLGYFSPVQTVEKVVSPPFIGVGLQGRFHSRCSCDPHLLLFMVSPVPIESVHILSSDSFIPCARKLHKNETKCSQF